MGVVAVLAGVALTAVFAASGIAKLRDPAGTREAVTGFGVPKRLQFLVAVGLAPAEIVVAVLLLIPPTSFVGLILAIAMLTAFTVVVVLALRAGRRPDCRCFGRLGGADISVRTVVRNSVLIDLAALGLIGEAVAERPTGRPLQLAVYGGLALAAAILLTEGVAGRAARRRREAEDNDVFDVVEAVAVPDFRMATVAGGEATLAELLGPGLPLLLVTLSPGCGPCKRLRPDIARWGQVLSTRVTVAVLATGTREDNITAYADTPDLPVLIDEHRIRDQLGTGATPSAILVGPDRQAASGVANGEPLVRRLLVSVLTGVEVEDPGVDPDPAPEVAGTSADEISMDSRVKPLSGVTSHGLGDSTVLLDTSTGATVVVDRIGMLIWQVLDGTSPLAEIVTDVAAAFEAPAETVGADVLTLVQSFGRAGLLDGVAPDLGQPSRPDPLRAS